VVQASGSDSPKMTKRLLLQTNLPSLLHFEALVFSKFDRRLLQHHLQEFSQTQDSRQCR
jgi:hypothetical protein